MLDKGALVLEGVTLAQVVELVVQVLVNLAVVAVLDQETAEDAEAAHPEDLAISGVRTDVPLVASDDLFRESTNLGIRASAVPFLLPKPR